MAGLAGVNSGLEIPTGLNQLSGLSPGNGLVLSGNSRSSILAGTYSSVVAWAFSDNSLIIRDPITPANNYSGPLITAGVFNKFTYTRASTALFYGSNGLIQTASSGVPRIIYDPVTLAIQGYLHEGARTNSCLWSNDMTNAAWTKTNMTATLNQTGPDGVVNSASSLTATSGNATCLQTITLGSSARAQSAYIQRISGSGTINMTMDNGATWTAVVPTALWTKVRIPTQTLANPTVGFRIVTNGDAIAVAYCQNENATWDSSPIKTTTVAVTRAADALSLPNTKFNLTTAAGTLYVKNSWQGGTAIAPGSRGALTTSDGTTNNYVPIVNNGGTISFSAVTATVTQASLGTSAVADGVFAKAAGAYALNDFAVVKDGATPVTAASGTPPTTTKLTIGDLTSGFVLFGTIPEGMFVGQRVANTAMQSLTS